MATLWQNGIIDADLGTGVHRCVSGVPVYTNRTTYFVSSTHDRASNLHEGTDPEEPLATLAQALTNASAGDIIIVRANHVEVTTAHTISLAGLQIIGEGSAAARPQFSGGSADAVQYTFHITAAGVCIRNVRVWGGDSADDEGDIVDSLGCIGIASTGTFLESVQVNQGTDYAGTDDVARGRKGIALLSGSARPTLDNCELVNNMADEPEGATGATHDPRIGLSFDVACAGVRLIGTTFDGGTQGYDFGAVHVPTGVAVVDLYMQGCTFSNSADVQFAGTGTVRGWGYGNTFEGGSRFENDEVRFYENSLLASTEVGHAALVSTSLWNTGVVLYVDSTHANASDSNSGQMRNYPLATIGQAFTNATANNGDIVVIEKDHAETITSALVLSKAGVAYIGAGSGDNRALFTLDDTPGPPETAPAALFDISAAHVWLANIRCTDTVSSSTTTHLIDVGAAGIVINGCGFTQGAEVDFVLDVDTGGTDFWFYANTFTRSAVPANSPSHAIRWAHTTEGFCQVNDNQFDPSSSYYWGPRRGIGRNSGNNAAVGVHVYGNAFYNGAGAEVPVTASELYLLADNDYNAGTGLGA